MDCSLCSFMQFLFCFISNVLIAALEYWNFFLIISVAIGLILASNLLIPKFLCAVSGFRCSYVKSSDSNNFAYNFDYGPVQGPHAWCCTNSNQSPINIIESEVQKLPLHELLNWNHYDDLPSSIILENNGHTVILRAYFNGNTPTISGADLFASYTFVELCFRWSLLSNDGSEHMINYRKYPLELQVIHRTGPRVECISSYDLLTLAYFYEISSHNLYLDPLIQNLYRIREPGSKIEISPFPLSYLCHKFRDNFYSYGGSLTEPPCYEGVEWFVFPEPLAISERQLSEFRQLEANLDGKGHIIRNSRPVQNIKFTRIVNLNQYNPIDAYNINRSNSFEEHGDEEDSSD